MISKHGKSTKGFSHEVRAILKRARQVWRLVPHRHKGAFGVAALLMALTSACSTALPVFLGKLVDQVKHGTEQGLTADALYRVALFYLVLIAGAYVLREGLQVVRRYLVEDSCTRIEKVMTIKLIAHLLKVDLATLNQEKIGALNGRISRSIVGFVRFLRLGFLDFFPAVATGIFALVTVLTKQPWLGLAMAGVIPASLFLTIRQIISQKNVRLMLMRSRELMDGTVVEQLSGLDYVRAANTQQYEVERVARAAEKRRAKEIRHHFQMSLFGCAKALNEGFFHILVLAVSIYLAIWGMITFGDILTFSMLFLNVMAPLSEIHRVIDEGHECSLQVADLLEMLSEPTDRSFSPDSTQEPRLEPGSPALVTQDLRLEYTAADGQRRLALDGVTMTIRHGETIGVAGRSGCGKSSWLRVLMRLAHPCDGAVTVGGVALDSVSRGAIGRLVGYVGQSPFVFAGTIAENIAYGSPDVTEEDIRRAAERAHIHDEILAMPGGYAGPVTERGQNLSGGQRQRLALARVFLKNPPVLILDEGTSALDTISERHVQRAIEMARADCTVILVAHRLSTLRDTDRIFVFDSGHIVETGTYTELLCRGGVFSELVRSAEEGRASLTTASPPPATPQEQEPDRVAVPA
jgi:ATP-binding cassette subfamily B protein